MLLWFKRPGSRPLEFHFIRRNHSRQLEFRLFQLRNSRKLRLARISARLRLRVSGK